MRYRVTAEVWVDAPDGEEALRAVGGELEELQFSDASPVDFYHLAAVESEDSVHDEGKGGA